jgi:hypothetical protein
MAPRAPAAPALVDGRAAAVAADLTAGHPSGGRPEEAAAAAPWHHVHDLPRVGGGTRPRQRCAPIPRGWTVSGAVVIESRRSGSVGNGAVRRRPGWASSPARSRSRRRRRSTARCGTGLAARNAGRSSAHRAAAPGGGQVGLEAEVGAGQLDAAGAADGDPLAVQGVEGVVHGPHRLGVRSGPREPGGSSTTLTTVTPSGPKARRSARSARSWSRSTVAFATG